MLPLCRLWFFFASGEGGLKKIVFLFGELLRFRGVGISPPSRFVRTLCVQNLCLRPFFNSTPRVPLIQKFSAHIKQLPPIGFCHISTAQLLGNPKRFFKNCCFVIAIYFKTFGAKTTPNNYKFSFHALISFQTNKKNSETLLQVPEIAITPLTDFEICGMMI